MIGSGAGGRPVAYCAARAVLGGGPEKGPWLGSSSPGRAGVLPARGPYAGTGDERHVIEQADGEGWRSTPTQGSGWNFWNGNCVGGSSNFMSGYFHRLKTGGLPGYTGTFGPIDGANVADWPIQVCRPRTLLRRHDRTPDRRIGKADAHANSESRSGADFPFPPTSNIDFPRIDQVRRADSAFTRPGAARDPVPSLP